MIYKQPDCWSEVDYCIICGLNMWGVETYTKEHDDTIQICSRCLVNLAPHCMNGVAGNIFKVLIYFCRRFNLAKYGNVWKMNGYGT